MNHDSAKLIRDSHPDYARDLKLNLGSVLTSAGAPGLSDQQIWSVALASRHRLAQRARSRARSRRPRGDVPGCGPSAGRARGGGHHGDEQHLLPLPASGRGRRVSGLPARLRMNVLANPGIDKLDFELLSLAVSAINGCGLCISSHEKKLRAAWRNARDDPERGAHRRHDACSRGGIRVLGRPGRAPGAGGPGPLKARPGSHSERLTPRGSARHTSKHASARPNLPLVVALLRTRSGRWTLLHSVAKPHRDQPAHQNPSPDTPGWVFYCYA